MGTVATLDPLTSLNKDLRTAAKVLSDEHARFLVDRYYQIQDFRKATGNQVRSDEPAEVIDWFFNNFWTLEKNIKAVLDKYTDGHPMGRWLKAIHGIGPVLSAGLLAHLSIEPWRCYRRNYTELPCNDEGGEYTREGKKQTGPCTARCGFQRVETAGGFWKFAGLDPTSEWKPKTVRPWNARLKTLCWKIGESFIKQSSNDACFYGHLYAERMAYETAKNENGEYAEEAARALSSKNWDKTTKSYQAYVQGKLPNSHLVSRARRYAVKIFLSHLHEVWYKWHFGEVPPKPYAMSILGHAHYIPPPAHSVQ